MVDGNNGVIGSSTMSAEKFSLSVRIAFACSIRVMTQYPSASWKKMGSSLRKAASVGNGSFRNSASCGSRVRAASEKGQRETAAGVMLMVSPVAPVQTGKMLRNGSRLRDATDVFELRARRSPIEATGVAMAESANEVR